MLLAVGRFFAAALLLCSSRETDHATLPFPLSFKSKQECLWKHAAGHDGRRTHRKVSNACLCCLPGCVTHYGILIHHRAFLVSFVKHGGKDTARWRTRVRGECWQLEGFSASLYCPSQKTDRSHCLFCSTSVHEGGACASTQQDGAGGQRTGWVVRTHWQREKVAAVPLQRLPTILFSSQQSAWKHGSGSMQQCSRWIAHKMVGTRQWVRGLVVLRIVKD